MSKTIADIFAERDERRAAEMKEAKAAREVKEDRELVRAALRRIAEPKIRGSSDSAGGGLATAALLGSAFLLSQ